MSKQKKAAIAAIIHEFCDRYQDDVSRDPIEIAYEDRVVAVSEALSTLFDDFPKEKTPSSIFIVSELQKLIAALKNLQKINLNDTTRRVITAKFAMEAVLKKDNIKSDYIDKTLTVLGIYGNNKIIEGDIVKPIEELVELIRDNSPKPHTRNLKAEYLAHKCRSYWRYLTAQTPPQTVKDETQPLLPFTEKIFGIVFVENIPSAKANLNKKHDDELYRMLNSGWG